MKKNLIVLNILLTASLATLVGCVSTTPMQPGAERVIITKEAVSGNCKWKGKVSAVNESRSMSGGQHSTLLEDEFSRMRNQAMQLGANTIVLSPSSGMTDKKHWAIKSEHKTTASHVYAGNAYWCPTN